nr:MAG TPA: hypothetical protein [Caudoviricetes sp.]DAN82661.1 MAG TPA: hypothetical protein [Caudoviricetes sp.]DAQ67566.1 MAG TPA: hypothetical protein [Caudoviricetes sp.]DAQ74548.1 MAG TPA: hypothetical protein [Caudoviricetes sp.]
MHPSASARLSLLYSIKETLFLCFDSRYTFKNKSCLARYCLGDC